MKNTHKLIHEYNRLISKDNQEDPSLTPKEIKRVNKLSQYLFGYTRHQPELFICDWHGLYCPTDCEILKENSR